MASAFACRPDYIVIDFSWALLHSASIIFAQEPLAMHIHRLWALLKEDCEENERTVRLRICASHFIKSVSRRLAKMNLEKQVCVCWLCSPIFTYVHLYLFVDPIRISSWHWSFVGPATSTTARGSIPACDNPIFISVQVTGTEASTRGCFFERIC